MDRIKTKVPGLDELLSGGIPKANVVLVVGTPGTGKSILCSQILYGNAIDGKRCLYVSTEQAVGRIEVQMVQFGFDIRKVGNLKVLNLDVDDPNSISYMLNEVSGAEYDLICLDSLDSITSNPIHLANLSIKSEGVIVPVDPENLRRLRLKSIFRTLVKSLATVFMISERIENQPGLTRDTISEFLCDGIIVLHAVEGEEGFRTLTIPKMRYTKQRSGIYSFEITRKGIVVKSEG